MPASLRACALETGRWVSNRPSMTLYLLCPAGTTNFSAMNRLSGEAGHKLRQLVLMLDDIPILGGKYEEQLPGPSQPDTKQFVKN